jgi:pimeloyl-ACP methyl ester carboxylesterase
MISFIDFGGKGPVLHFAHANGYPPECYSPLLELLSEHHHVIAMHQRPLWPGTIPGWIKTWRPLTDDFLRFLDEQNPGPIIGVGHSLGGIVTLRAALREPRRFRALILLDPVLLPPATVLFLGFLRIVGLSHLVHPLARETINRRNIYANPDEIFENYRHKSIFKYISDVNLHKYIIGLTHPRTDGQLELRYSPEWEARIYITGMWKDMDIWRDLSKLEIPLLIIRGEETDTFWQRTARLVQRKLPKTLVETVNKASHLVPLERPSEVSALIQMFTENCLG